VNVYTHAKTTLLPRENHDCPLNGWLVCLGAGLDILEKKKNILPLPNK
jgi:hypothetical protein